MKVDKKRKEKKKRQRKTKGERNIVLKIPAMQIQFNPVPINVRSEVGKGSRDAKWKKGGRGISHRTIKPCMEKN